MRTTEHVGTAEGGLIKALVIGVYLDGTGWAQACIDNILALDAAGVDVVCRPVKLNNVQSKVPERILQLQAKDDSNCEVVIQHLLPHHMNYSGHFKLSIGIYETETDSFKDSVWAERLNCMDELWVPNQQMVEAARASGVVTPISVIPHATDTQRFMQSYDTLDMLKPYKDQNSFLFYFVGELVRRKNLPALLRAFHSEFDRDEPVELVIKTSQPGVSKSDLLQKVQYLSNSVKYGLKLYGGNLDAYKKEIVIGDRLTSEGIMKLHGSCDCLVAPSYGEAWHIPCFTSMAMGKTPIATACTGFLDYLSDKEGWLVPCRKEPVFEANETFSDLFTANENWWSIDIIELRKAMRTAYTQKQLRQEKACNGIIRAHDFSYFNVGSRMRRLLENGRQRNQLERTSRTVGSRIHP